MPRQNSAEYWARRMKRMEDALKDRSCAWAEHVEHQYDLARAELERQLTVWYQRLADNNGVSLAEARRLLTAGELKEFHWTVEEYIDYGRRNALDGAWMQELENASARVHISRLEAMELQFRQQAQALCGRQLEATGSAMREAYLDSYHHTAFEVQRGLGVGWTMQAVNERAVERVLSRPWTADGQTFRDRCWTNRDKLIQTLETRLTQAVIRGDAPDDAIRAISREMGVSKSKAGRLVMTESAALASAAQRDCFSELDVERFRVVATFDHDTCPQCGAMDGKVFPMSQFQVGLTAPPFHPWCRCCTCPYFEDMEGLGERWTRDPDGTTGTVPADMTFEEWMGTHLKTEQGAHKNANNSSDEGSGKPGEPVEVGTVDFDDTAAVMSRLQEAERELEGLDHEVCYTITSDGKVWRVEGTASTVDQAGIPSSLEGSYTYHNHPASATNYSFSAADVASFMENKEAFAIASDDLYIYYMARTDDTVDLPRDEVYHRFDLLERTAVWSLKWNEMIDPDLDGYHYVLKFLSQEMGFIYGREEKR